MSAPYALGDEAPMTVGRLRALLADLPDDFEFATHSKRSIIRLTVQPDARRVLFSLASPPSRAPRGWAG